MNDEPWRLLLVEDDGDIARQVKEYLGSEKVDGRELAVEHVQDFDTAFQELRGRRYDLLVVDIFRGEPSVEAEQPGRDVIDRVRATRFAPIVIYTALPRPVQDLAAPLIRVIPKTGDGLQGLKAAIEELIHSGIPEVNRLIVRHIDGIQRDFMWDFVSPRWEELRDHRDRHSLAYLLMRRLSHSLAREGAVQLGQALGAPKQGSIGADPDRVHPMEYYVHPPVTAGLLTGDPLRGQVAGQDHYWVVLTPSCDMVPGREKAESVLLAKCLPLNQFDEYQSFMAKQPPSNSARRELTSLLRNNRERGQAERFFFLPAALHIPNLVVDLQELATVSFAEAQGLTRIASIDSPFVELLATRFARYFGRLGVPDLDTDAVIGQLSPPQDETEA